METVNALAVALGGDGRGARGDEWSREPRVSADAALAEMGIVL